MNILIIEDDICMSTLMKSVFSKFPFVNIIEMSHNFQDGFDKSLSCIFDIILLDIHLGNSRYDGIELCKIIRKNNPFIPIVIITAFHSFYYLEKAFEAGANDYITKPFNIQELEIRVKRWFFRNYRVSSAQEKISYHELSYDPNFHQFHFKDYLLNLRKKSKSLLLIFLKEPEKLLSKSYLREKLWGDNDNIERGRNIRSNVQILRNVLRGTCDKWIKTVSGEGYVLAKKDFRI